MTERLRDAKGRYAPDPASLDTAIDAPNLGLLRYMERWARQQAHMHAQAQAQARARAAVIPRRRHTWRAGGLTRMQAWVARQPRDARGWFVGNARWTHGTTPSYRYGCRCPDCTAAWRVRMRAYMRWYRKARPQGNRKVCGP